jgi:ATP-dependent helicase/nuclease subunit B
VSSSGCPAANARVRHSCGSPSRWLLPTLRELSGDPGLAMTDWTKDTGRYGDALAVSGSFAGELLATDRLGDPQEWRTRAFAAGQPLDDTVVADARTMIDLRAGATFTAFDGNLAGASGLPDPLTSERPIAPTRLEAYAECPHAYFMQRLLRVEPLELPEELLTISALHIGNFLHRALELLANEKHGPLPIGGEPWTPTQREHLRRIAFELVEEFEERGITGHPRLWAVEREQLLNDLVLLLDDDDRVRLDRSASVLASELEFGTGDAPPVEIVVPGGRVLMKGSADRVDRRADGTLVVIDMKTGGDSRYAKIARGDDPLVRGTKLQLPVYAHAARQRYGTAAAEAEYWFVRRGMNRIAVPLADVEERYEEVVGLLARSMRDGVFPHRPPETADHGWTQCPYCNPDRIGHTEARERWERKRRDPLLAQYVGLVEPEALADDAGEEA